MFWLYKVGNVLEKKEGSICSGTLAIVMAKDVNVNAIAPSYIATDNTVALRDDENRSRSTPERIPAGRLVQPG